MNIQKVIRIVSIVQLVYLVYSYYIKIVKRRRRLVNPTKHTRDIGGCFNSCFAKIKAEDGEHFANATRMSVSKFNILLNFIKPRLELHSQRRPIKPEIRLAITLMYLAHGCSVKILGWSFKMGESTIREIVYETCDAIWEELSEEYVAPPNFSELKNIAQDFWNERKMPNCIGTVDAKYITTKYPVRSHSVSSFKKEKRRNIILLAACDTKHRFTLVDVGAIKSQRDGGIFPKESVARKILNGTYTVPGPQSLPLENLAFPYYFISNAAFPLKATLMRPYLGRILSPERENFNERLSKTLSFIENSFGILASRWRVLANDLSCAPKNAYKIILATIVLHNFLIAVQDSEYFTEQLVDREEDGRVIPGQWRKDGVELPSTRIFRTNRTTTVAFSLRDKLTNYLLRNA